jgi:hypothetical protein
MKPKGKGVKKPMAAMYGKMAYAHHEGKGIGKCKKEGQYGVQAVFKVPK